MQGEILLALVKEVESENRRLSNPSSWRQLCGQRKWKTQVACRKEPLDLDSQTQQHWKTQQQT